mgnify:CR=1 FL=1
MMALNKLTSLSWSTRFTSALSVFELPAAFVNGSTLYAVH